jgi:GH24 family phage-related lysozyme (muramidase)
MKISEEGIQLIQKFEGCRLEAYQDPVGVWTIGYGHTSGVKKGMKISPEVATEFLRRDLVKAELAVTKYDNKYHWTQNEYDALCSFAYNIGSINQLTARGDRTKEEISAKIPEYKKAGGKVLEGLVKRRAAEKELFDRK